MTDVINHYALTALRIKDGRKRVDLARAAGISPQYYGELESGRRTAANSPDVVKALAVALDVPMSALTCCHDAADKELA